YLQSKSEIQQLEQSTRESANQVGDLVVGAVEYAMLQGDGISVKKLITGFKARVTKAEIRIYDRRGLEVFGEPATGDPGALPKGLTEAMSSGARQLGD